MVQTLENIDKSKVSATRIEGLDEVVSGVIGDTLTGAVSTITTTDLTAGKILVSDNNGKVAASNKTISDIGGDSDNLSITKNSSNKLQTIGVINQNNTTSAIKTWTGTLAQYNAIATKDSNTLYWLTDGNKIYKGTTLIANNTEVDQTYNSTSTNAQSGIAVESAISGKADKNLANSTVITNCITEIPQDIKLELADGVLTLKAGSKFYVPNGAGVFDTVTIANDITGTYTASSSQRMFFYNVTNGYIQSCQVADVYSGATSPTRSGTIYWYDTTNNLVKRSSNGGSTWDTTVYSLPYCLCSVTNNNISSIDQVFNGFGYIGSTVYALPGVKGLIPNGRNEDGSLKNTEFTVDSIKTATRTWVDGGGQVWGYIKNPPTGAAETWYWNRYIESDEEPSSNEYTMWYKPSENITYMNNGAQSSTPNWKKVNYINFGKASGINSQEIKIFTPKTTFNAVDYNDYSHEVDNTVHKTGNETIIDLKTFKSSSSGVALATKSDRIDSDITPSSIQFSNFIDGYDVNGNLISRIYTVKTTNGTNGIAIQAWKGSTNFGIGVNSDGTTIAPTPPASDNGSNIATTYWARANIKCVPNFNAASYWGTNVYRNADVDGIIYGRFSINSNTNYRSVLKINNSEIGSGYVSSTLGADSFFSLPVAKGDYIIFTGQAGLFFAPYKGGSL